MIPPCKYRGAFTKDGKDCACACPKLLHPGTVPVSVCNICPYVTPPSTDFFTATAQLLVTRQRVGEYVATPKPCGGCKKKKEKKTGKPANRAMHVPEERSLLHTDALQFVWCYWHGGAGSDEIRYSMRSIEKHYQGASEFVVIGDKPPWYDGIHIPQRRQKHGKGFERGLRDVLLKLHTLSRHPDINQDFVWMMDDVFMLKPTTLEELQTPRASKEIGDHRKNRWQRIKTATANRLRRNGFPTLDFATHLPHYVEKEKLQEVFEVFNPLTQVFLWEVAYHNFHRHSKAPARPFLSRIRKEHPWEWYTEAAKTSTFLNVSGGAWTNTLRNWLLDSTSKHHREIGMEPVKAELIEPQAPDTHVILTRSMYADPHLSLRRLKVTARTYVPAMKSQTVPFELIVCVHPDDVYLAERKKAFELIGVPVKFVYRKRPYTLKNLYSQKWRIPKGKRTLVTDIDDDDIVTSDFCEITQLVASQCKYATAVLDWPNGYVWDHGKLHRLANSYNQFISVLSNTQRYPLEASHRAYEGAMPRVIVEQSRGWTWVRHGDAEIDTLSDTLPRYVRKDGGSPNLKRWAVPITSPDLLKG